MRVDDATFSTRLRALNYPSTFDPSDPGQACALYVWLEDHHIRQLPISERGPLRAFEPAAVRAFVVECQAPVSIIAHLDAGRHRPVCSWLLGVALAYEYGDKYETYEAAYKAATPAVSPASPSASLIQPDDPELKLLATALKLQPESDASLTLQAVVRAARSLPRRAPSVVPAVTVPPSTPPAAVAGAAALGVRAASSSGRDKTSHGALAPLSEETFPLGFSLGDSTLDDAARVLRMLHVQRLRAMQDAVNKVIECLQEFTANPKTDARLGKVGR